MAKFHVGQKVLVTVNHPEESLLKIGDIVKVTKFIGEDNIGENYELDGFWYIHGEYLSPITEPPETMIINGVEYVRKHEPAHEWKFGDVAEHRAYGVGIVCGIEERGDVVAFIEKETLSRKAVFTDNLTFLRRTDFSV